MLKSIAPAAKKPTTLTVAEKSDSKPENVPSRIMSTPVRCRTTTTTQTTT